MSTKDEEFVTLNEYRISTKDIAIILGVEWATICVEVKKYYHEIAFGYPLISYYQTGSELTNCFLRPEQCYMLLGFLWRNKNISMTVHATVSLRKQMEQAEYIFYKSKRENSNNIRDFLNNFLDKFEEIEYQGLLLKGENDGLKLTINQLQEDYKNVKDLNRKFIKNHTTSGGICSNNDSNGSPIVGNAPPQIDKEDIKS